MVLYGGDVRSRIVGDGDSELVKGKDMLDFIEVDGVPTTVIRCTERYAKAVLKSKGVNQAYSYIRNKLSECDIRWIFPELYVAWNNAHAAKAHRRYMSEYMTAKKRGTLKKHSSDAKYIRGITTGGDIRSAASHYGTL